jgi:hypothetical protein
LSIAAPVRFVGAVGGTVSVVDGIVIEAVLPSTALPKTSLAMTWNS